MYPPVTPSEIRFERVAEVPGGALDLNSANETGS